MHYLMVKMTDDLENYNNENQLEPKLEDNVSLQKKKTIIQFIEERPTYKFTTFQRRFSELKHRNYVPRWKEDIARGILSFSEEFIKSN